MLTVKLKVNLKVSSTEIFQRGHVFRGPVEELPGFVQTIVEERDHSVAEITFNEAPAEVSVDAVNDQLDPPADDPSVDGAASEGDTEVIETPETPETPATPETPETPETPAPKTPDKKPIKRRNARKAK